MGTMNKMRENTGIILWILVISFGGLWVLQDSGVFDTIGANPLGELAIVNGDPVTLGEYNRQLEALLEQIRQATGETIPPQQLEQQRERAYNMLVNNKLLQQEMDRLGVTVSDAEIRELIRGENPHEIIRANFSNPQGELDRVLLQNFIDNPEQAATWLQIEEYIRLERRSQKFDNLITSTARISESDIEDAYNKEALEADAEFFFLRYAAVPDDSVTITDRDLERNYEDNKEEYRRERRYSIDLASIPKEPARDDTLAYLRDAEMILPDFAEAEDDSAYLAQNGSDEQYSAAFLGASDMAPEIAELLFESPQPIEPGLMVEPTVVGEAVHLVKVVATRPAQEIHVRARHILTEGSDSDARAASLELLGRIRAGEEFAVVAREASDDPGSGARGGDLGWFGEGRMVPAFQDAAFGAAVGRIVGPVESEFGFHLIEVTHRGDVEVQIAEFVMALEPSVGTLSAIQEQLEDLQFYAEESGDFAGETARRGTSLQTMDMEKGQVSIPGFGPSRSLAQFLDSSSPGDISPVIELDEAVILVHVVAIEEEGYRPLEEVEPMVRARVLLEGKKEFQAQRLGRGYAKAGFDGLAEDLGFSAEVAEGISFRNQMVPGLGRDPVFAGTVLALSEGEDSGVVEGRNAAFVARVGRRSEPASITDADRARLRSQLVRELEGRLRTDWITALRDRADIQDLRSAVLLQ